MGELKVLELTMEELNCLKEILNNHVDCWYLTVAQETLVKKIMEHTVVCKGRGVPND